jgi:membrane protein DedA with SNARE-associated domain
MTSTFVAALLQLAGQGPLLQAVLIVAGTFVLEDAATVLAAMQAESGGVSAPLALGALYVGIVLGDLGLYLLGRLATRLRWAHRLVPPPRRRQSQAWLGRRVGRVVFVSRFLPGARLPTYTACGFLGASFGRFAAAAVGATLIWTTLLFSLALRMNHLLADGLGAWRWAGFAVLALIVVVAWRAAASLQETR